MLARHLKGLECPKTGSRNTPFQLNYFWLIGQAALGRSEHEMKVAVKNWSNEQIYENIQNHIQVDRTHAVGGGTVYPG